MANECVVPEMVPTELYECCGSTAAENTCTAFGFTNGIVLAFVIFYLIYMNMTSTWFNSNLVLSFTVLFQSQPAMFRTWFYLAAGFKGTDVNTYIIVRPSDSGDFVVSLGGLIMYLY